MYRYSSYRPQGYEPYLPVDAADYEEANEEYCGSQPQDYLALREPAVSTSVVYRLDVDFDVIM